MTAKVDETLSKIPVLKINLEDIFDFGGKCIDQLAIEIITESLDYALETSVRRLESVAKINPHIRDAATETILPAVKTLRNVIEQAPHCPTSALSSAPIKEPPPKTRVKTETKKETKKKDIVETLTKTVTEAKKEAKKEKEAEKGVVATQSDATQKALAGIKKQDPAMYDTIVKGMAEGKTPLEAMQLDVAGVVVAAKEQKEKLAQEIVASAKPSEISRWKAEPNEDTIHLGQRIKNSILLKIYEARPPIETGKQFTVGFDGEERKFHLVTSKVAKLATQTPEEEGVIKLSDASALAKAVAGKKSGESADITIEGKKYTAQIREVKEGRMKVIG
jgi:transcription elongation GreA/GreB family factor